MQYQIPGIRKLPFDAAIAAVPQGDIRPVTGPELSYWALQRSRYAVDAAPQIHQGPTIQPTFPIPPVSEPEFRHYVSSANRHQDLIVKRFEDATVQQSYVFYTGQPEFSCYVSRLNELLTGPVQQLDVATVAPQIHTFVPNQPELRYWTPEINRFMQSGPVRQTDGATPQQTYVFPVNQPRQSYIALASVFLGGAIAITYSPTLPVVPGTAARTFGFDAGIQAYLPS